MSILAKYEINLQPKCMLQDSFDTILFLKQVLNPFLSKWMRNLRTNQP
jgi:hypothetical protein